MNYNETENLFYDDNAHSVNFVLPELISPEIWEIIHEKTNEHVSCSINLTMSNLLHKIANYVLPCHNPRLAFAALFYAADIDVSYILNCQNTETGIAKSIGSSKQAFNSQLQKVRKEFGFNHSSGMRQITKETYANNSKQIKNANH